MRHSGFISFQSGLIFLLAVLVSGCSSAGSHNDVMLFGTTTKFALDISAPPETAGTPQLTVGYKRQEFVWMPLYVNGQESAFLPNGTATTDTKKDGKYVGEDGDQDKDTYSVLATFGAKGGSGSGAAFVGLAQLFSTGIAARKLAEQPTVSQLFSTQAATGIDEAKVKALLKESLETKAKATHVLTEYLDENKDGILDDAKLKKLFEGEEFKENFLNKWKGKSVLNFLNWVNADAARAEDYTAKAEIK